MAEFAPFHIRTELDPDQCTRVRWTVWDPYGGLFKSSKNFATEREALYDAERFIDRRQNVWQRRHLTKTPKRPRDLNQWAKRMVDLATGDAEDREPTPEERGVDPAASAMGKKGGPARAASMTPERRKEIAKKAAEKRWKRKIPENTT
jgi:hypothetical protein